VGEFWKDSITDLEVYLDGLGTQFSVFDAPLHYNFKEAGDRGREYDLRAIWDGTVVQKRPIDAVTLVENHECVLCLFASFYMILNVFCFSTVSVWNRSSSQWTLTRICEQQVGQSLESAVNPTFKPLAYALILLRPSGYPCVLSSCTSSFVN
jgi:alpha-amylase